jgi:hypothetical protein
LEWKFDMEVGNLFEDPVVQIGRKMTIATAVVDEDEGGYEAPWEESVLVPSVVRSEARDFDHLQLAKVWGE